MNEFFLKRYKKAKDKGDYPLWRLVLVVILALLPIVPVFIGLRALFDAHIALAGLLTTYVGVYVIAAGTLSVITPRHPEHWSLLEQIYGWVYDIKIIEPFNVDDDEYLTYRFRQSLNRE